MLGMKLQEWIHRIEEGPGIRYVKYGFFAIALISLVLLYNVRIYRNMNTQEAMDAAQLGRNLAEGRGYTTQFVRPFSMYLISRHNTSKGDTTDPSRIRQAHPDIANPPVYPVVLAALQKVLPIKHEVPAGNSFWNKDGRFWWYPPDFLISIFNQLLFFASAVLLFFLARRLFDPAVAWLTAAVYLGTEMFWRFAASGLSTTLLVLIFLGLVWSLVALEQRAREETAPPSRLLLLALLAGLMVGLGALTRYSFGWMIIPVVAFLILFGARMRVLLALTALGAFLLLLTPWVVRNYQVSGTLFGIAGYVVVENTASFPDTRLGRSINPDLTKVRLDECWYKSLTNLREIFRNDLPRLGGSWITAFFLVGLMVPFRNPSLSRLRYFLLFSLLVLALVQAAGRTHLSDDVKEINSENLLALTVPLVLMFGVGLFMILLEQVPLPFPQLRYGVIGVFMLAACAPLIFVLLPPRVSPVAYPPYFPPVIQKSAEWMNPDELMMSDIPWAVAWYGRRQCLWYTLNAQEDFFAINDYQKPIQALYLTPRTMDNRFLTEWVRAGEHSWGSFILESIVRREVPRNFPLKKAPPGFLPEQLFLSDRERWAQAAP